MDRLRPMTWPIAAAVASMLATGCIVEHCEFTPSDAQQGADLVLDDASDGADAQAFGQPSQPHE